MKRCEFCSTDLPDHANFCHKCGHPVAERTPVVFDYTFPEAPAPPAPNTPRLFSSLLYAITANHARRSHTSRLHSSTAAATSKVRVGIATRWLIVALTAVAVVITSSIILVRALTPATSPDLRFTASSVAPAKLIINPTALRFGSIEVGRTVKLSVTVSNSGGSRLNWTATVDGSNTNWLTLQNSAGAIEVNGRDEAFTVTANTNHLLVGPYSATLHIHSNGGNATLMVMLGVTAATTTLTQTTPPASTLPPSPTTQPSPGPILLPTPSPSPTLPQPPKITVTPLKIGPTSSNCSQNSDGTYNCSVTVGETVPGKLHWFSVVKSGGTGTSIIPSSGTLSANQPQQPVTIASIPCHNNSFTFKDQNGYTVKVSWRCKPLPPSPPLPPPPPMLMANPKSISNSN